MFTFKNCCLDTIFWLMDAYLKFTDDAYPSPPAHWFYANGELRLSETQLARWRSTVHASNRRRYGGIIEHILYSHLCSTFVHRVEKMMMDGSLCSLQFHPPSHGSLNTRFTQGAPPCTHSHTHKWKLSAPTHTHASSLSLVHSTTPNSTTELNSTELLCYIKRFITRKTMTKWFEISQRKQCAHSLIWKFFYILFSD